MEIKLGNSKGQLMSIAVLVFVLLMVAALLVLVVVSIGYNGVSQSAIITSSSTNYGSALRQSADAFAYASGTAALNALYSYESNATLRQTNLISNFSEYMRYLIVNGTLPNVAQGSSAAADIAGLMGNSTLAAYNSIISSVTGTGSKNITVIETPPVISQQNPYSISINYNEYVSMNTSSGIFSFTIPVNASIPINNTPDLFYAEQGVFRPIRFGSTPTLVSVIGNDYASSGNATAFAYGTVYVIPPPDACIISLPGSLGNSPYNSRIIIVTTNAFYITTPGCTALDNYGGLITNYVDVPPQSVPYLNFSLTNNVLQYLSTGQKVLLYGPGLDVLNVTGLIDAVQSNKYFTSPFASSFADRAEGNLGESSQAGIFTFSGSNRQGMDFNGDSTEIVSSEQQQNIVSYTVAAWIYPYSNIGGTIVSDRGNGAGDSLDLALGGVSTNNKASPGSFIFGVNSNGVAIGVNTLAEYASGNWYFVVGTFNAISGASVSSSDFQLYVNGELAGTAPWWDAGSATAPLSGEGDMLIGTGAFGSFNGIMANLQIYNSTLSQYQVMHLYQEGIEGLPISTNTLLGWYPLNGNAQDMSGQNTAVPYGASYQLLPGYTRDSILPGKFTQLAYPVPGIGNCDTVPQCTNESIMHLYMGDAPLSINNAKVSAAYFTSNSAYFEQGSGFKYMESQQNSGTPATFTSPFSYSIWVYPQSSNGMIVDERGSPGLTGQGGGTWQDSWLNLADGTLYMNVWASSPPCISLGQIPMNQWSNLIVVYTGSALYGYINGVQSGSDPSVTRLAPGGQSGNGGFSAAMFYPLGMADPLQSCIGAGNAAAGGPGSGAFTGMMSNYQWYGSALSQQQINQIYNGGLTGAPVNSLSLMGWWPLNGNLNDYSGFQNTGVSNDLAFEYVSLNASNPLQAASSNSVGLSSLSGINGEWQTIGFGQQSMQPVYWNVTAWNLSSSSVQLIPYIVANNMPLHPAYGLYYTYPFQNGAFFSGIPGGTQQWNFGNIGYVGSTTAPGTYDNFFGSGFAQYFPFSVNSLNAYVDYPTCSAGTYNTTGFTAVATMQLGGTYDVQESLDDEQEVWFRNPAITTGWIPIFNPAGENPWTYQVPQSRQAVNISLAPATYQVAVNQMNGCLGGLSSISIARYPSQLWTVYAFGTTTNSNDEILFSSMFPTPYNPLSPTGSTLQQTSYWYGGQINGNQAWSYGMGGEYYSNTGSSPGPGYVTYGIGTQPFPQPLSDLNTVPGCSGTQTANTYVATTTMSLSGTYDFNVRVDDQMAIFYRPVGGSWSVISSMVTGASGPWPSGGGGQGPTSYGPYSVAFTSGAYQLAVVWNNLCAGGSSSFQMYPA